MILSDSVIQIQDGVIVIAIDPAAGNNVVSMTVRGHEIVWAHGQPGHSQGIPLLAPWANRIDGDAFYANGKKYLLNSNLGNLRYDGNHLPIHGLIGSATDWKVIRRDAVSVSSRLEFWRFPQWMAQFPFAHVLEITHRLEGGSLEIETAVENLSADPMPLCIGYHPYFQLDDSPRDEWQVQIPARDQVVLTDKLIPTGERKPLPRPVRFPLAGLAFDDVFTGLTGAPFTVEGREQRVEVSFGPKYPVGIVYAPPGNSFICFEPMSALTNAFNLDHAGITSELQHVPPGSIWRETFRITPTGFK